MHVTEASDAGVVAEDTLTFDLTTAVDVAMADVAAFKCGLFIVETYKAAVSNDTADVVNLNLITVIEQTASVDPIN